ncbi:DnaB-like helicase C-terminal domain-containing protein [Gellertiella hungarica]|uniref:DNA 5'-3' helicase n=1 Tax=Gellertiella hungarica TaxID=1572859 RepID=A0A7W6J2N2_9HYPH|nr:DnaB-like helicase C-terminal domain-containing protein [Gellertiella hungarica]MBB4063659.1 replicative DNA helicase [Gellertiella hungarica]
MNAMSIDRSNMDRITEDDAFAAAEVFFACMFANNDVLKDAGLAAEDFGEWIHQVIYDRALELYRTTQNVNPVALKPFLPKHLERMDCTPAQYLSRLAMAGADPTLRDRLEGSIQIIKGVALARYLAREADTVTELSREGHGLLTLLDEIDHLQSRIKDVSGRLSSLRSTVSPGSAYLQMFSHSSNRDGVVGVPIALQEIAHVLSEPVFEAGNLYGLLSSSGEGKSSLTMQLIHKPLMAGHPVLFLSYDQSAAQCMRQMIAQNLGISVRQQRDPMRMMTQQERDQCVKFAMDMDSRPFEIIRCQREGVAQLVAYARRFIKQRRNGNTPFIVIDHIGKVKPRDPKLSPDRISGEVTAELKALANETDSAVLILTQRNSFGTRRDNPRPIAADLYGGEGAKADFDAIVYLYRPEKYKAERMATAATDADWKKINKVFGEDVEGIAEIGSVKVRFGDPTIKERLKFEAEFTRYAPMKPARAEEFDF